MIMKTAIALVFFVSGIRAEPDASMGKLLRGDSGKKQDRILSSDQMCLSSSCTPAVLDSIACADQECHSCKARILWLMSESGGSLTQIDACNLVALEEFPDECGGCAPQLSVNPFCGCESCTEAALESIACDNEGECHSCGARIAWLKSALSMTEYDACLLVADDEFPGICGDCNPSQCHSGATSQPTISPTVSPTHSPTEVPTGLPTHIPTFLPTISPTKSLGTPTTKCTGAHGDPYAPDASDGVCCDGLQLCLDDHFDNGHWHYRCYENCDDTPNYSSLDFCGCEETCTFEVLDSTACGGSGCHSCGSRMEWLMSTEGGSYSQKDSCRRVANEFSSICGPCHCGGGGSGGTDAYTPPEPADLIWNDEFDTPGPPDPTKWNYRVGGGGFGNNELQYYTDHRKNSEVSTDGILKLRAVREDYGGRQYTSARLHTTHKGDWLYGRMIIRARLLHCTGRGTWPAIWMLPTEWKYGGWPESGEIDIMEHVGYDTGRVYGTVHTEAYNHMIGTQVGKSVTTDVEEWHDYEVVWTPDQIDFVLDGVKYHEFQKKPGATYREWPFDEEFHLILNVAVGGNWGGLKGIDESAFEGDGQIMEVDWVRIYRK